jgi:energy-coupling factor transporter ATP-binding protein EcfA2
MAELATYLLSLEVENVRCFGPRQRLDLSDGNGRPGQWTVILGDNGVGKTTLLQCLVALEPRRHFIRRRSHSSAPQVELPIPSSEWKIYRDPARPEETGIRGQLAVGSSLAAADPDQRSLRPRNRPAAGL